MIGTEVAYVQERYGPVWLYSFRRVQILKTVKKNQADTAVVCRHILQDLALPRRKLSFRTAGNLMFGVVCMWREQVSDLLARVHQLVVAQSTFRKFIDAQTSFDKSLQSKKASKRPRKKARTAETALDETVKYLLDHEEELEEDENDPEELMPLNTAAIADITLKEAPSSREISRFDIQENDSDFGEFDENATELLPDTPRALESRESEITINSYERVETNATLRDGSRGSRITKCFSIHVSEEVPESFDKENEAPVLQQPKEMSLLPVSPNNRLILRSCENLEVSQGSQNKDWTFVLPTLNTEEFRKQRRGLKRKPGVIVDPKGKVEIRAQEFSANEEVEAFRSSITMALKRLRTSTDWLHTSGRRLIHGEISALFSQSLNFLGQKRKSEGSLERNPKRSRLLAIKAPPADDIPALEGPSHQNRALEAPNDENVAPEIQNPSLDTENLPPIGQDQSSVVLKEERASPAIPNRALSALNREIPSPRSQNQALLVPKTPPVDENLNLLTPGGSFISQFPPLFDKNCNIIASASFPMETQAFSSQANSQSYNTVVHMSSQEPPNLVSPIRKFQSMNFATKPGDTPTTLRRIQSSEGLYAAENESEWQRVREEWSEASTLRKIYHEAEQERKESVAFEKLRAKMENRKSAALGFASLLHLNAKGLIRLEKDPSTYHIKQIHVITQMRAQLV